MFSNILPYCKTFLHFLDSHNGTLTFLATLVLVLITAYYALQAKNQVNESHDMVEQSRHQEKMNQQQTGNIRSNYVFLLNSEIQVNALNLVIFQWYAKRNSLEFSHFKRILIKSRHLSDSTWKLINVEAAKYFSAELMEELVGYYIGIEHIQKMLESISSADNNLWIELSKTQLLTHLKCTKLLEQEIGHHLRKRLNYAITNGEVVTIDLKTGEVVLSTAAVG